MPADEQKKSNQPKKGGVVKKKTDAAHPKSRRARQLVRGHLRHQKISSQKGSRKANLIFPLLDRLTWFQLFLEPEATQLPVAQVHQLIEQYIARFDEELERLREAQRPGRPIPKRVDELKAVQKVERDEYTQAGFQIPDLTSAANVTALRAWDGTREALHHVTLVRLKCPQQ